MSPTGMMGRKCEVLGTGSLKMAVPMSAFRVDWDEDVQGDFWMMMVSITAIESTQKRRRKLELVRW